MYLLNDSIVLQCNVPTSCTVQDYGELEFQSTEVILKIVEETGERVHAIPLPGGEPYDVAKMRTARFFNVSSKITKFFLAIIKLCLYFVLKCRNLILSLYIHM
jgi:hypothetical protein